MKIFSVSAFIAIALAVSGCAPSSGPISNKTGGRIVLATVSDPKSFNPILAKETSTTAIIHHVFEGLTTTDGVTLEVVPALAKSWTVGPLGRGWLFHLRKDVLWADGKPFTADDVVFTFNDLIYNDAIPNSYRDIFTVDGKRIKVERMGDFLVKFTLPTPFAPFLRSLSVPILPKHLLQDAVKKGTFNSTWGVDAPLAKIVGTGPFQLAEYKSGQHVVLRRNPHYWKTSRSGKRLPYLDEVRFLIVQNQDVGFLKFQEGELDHYELRGADFPLLKLKEKEGNFSIYRTGPSFGSGFLFFNQDPSRVSPQKHRWFASTRFRQAVAHAIDKKSIIDIVYNGLAVPQDSAMSPSEGYFFTTEVTKYEYNPEKAKSILAEEGFRDIEFNLFTNAGVTERMKMAEMIRKDLEKVGMKVNLVFVEFNTLVSKLSGTGDWDAMILGLTGSIDPHFGANVWQSSGQLHLWYPKQKSPATAWEKCIDEIFNSGVQETDQAKRKTLYDEWQRLVSKELPVIYTVLPEAIVAVRNRFGNLKPTPYGGALHNLEEIYERK